MSWTEPVLDGILSQTEDVTDLLVDITWNVNYSIKILIDNDLWQLVLINSPYIF